MTEAFTADRIQAAYDRARSDLLEQRNDQGHWTGELSTSALATATAIMALVQVRRQSHISHQSPLTPLIDGGLSWLAAHQNEDGGWGDTTKSFSNISTTMLCHAVFHAATEPSTGKSVTAVSAVSNGNTHADADTAVTAVALAYEPIIDRAQAYIDVAGGVPAVVARYGKDKTFSVPILTHCALAGLVDWREVTQLPFELACLSAEFYKTVRLPVVSYALPALIAIGQVRHHFRPTRIPGLRFLRNRAKRRSLNVLERIQPSNGGFLEATPLTSFVTMSLAGMGLVNHPVVKKGVDFITQSVRDDGSWPIDTNLATWVTTLSVNALGSDLPDEGREPILRWLLDQQYKEVHPFTNADPGGWSWTDLPGGVPDADDTPGAILAILELVGESRVQSPESSVTNDSRLQFSGAGLHQTAAKPQALHGDRSRRSASPLPDDLVNEAHEAVLRGVKWLLDLQNRDGGWPTFCRGWGTLPFDRSSPDITAHCLRAMNAWLVEMTGHPVAATPKCGWQVPLAFCPYFAASQKGRLFLLTQKTSRRKGWLPLWFGNQHVGDDLNWTYGTARVGAAFRDLGDDEAPLAIQRIENLQNPEGGWGGDVGCPSSVEETALAVEVLLSDPGESSQLAAKRGLLWLIERVEDGTYREPTPIGFYFAKLWYFERLYPLIFTVAALRRACEVLGDYESM